MFAVVVQFTRLQTVHLFQYVFWCVLGVRPVLAGTVQFTSLQTVQLVVYVLSVCVQCLQVWCSIPDYKLCTCCCLKMMDDLLRFPVFNAETGDHLDSNNYPDF